MIKNHFPILIYRTDDGLTQLDVRTDGESVWLNIAEMATLFQRDRSVIGKHIKNVFAEGELDRESNGLN